MNRTFALAACLTLSACSHSVDQTDDFSGLAGLDAKSDSFSWRMKVAGDIKYGQPSDIAYHNPPRYTALRFDGKEGDQVSLTVGFYSGEPVAWIVDNSFKVLLQLDVNSSVDDGTCSKKPEDGCVHGTLNLPANASTTHYIILRDRHLDDQDFTVYLDGKAKDDFYSCATDSDCVAVGKGGCCSNGWKVAVNSGEVDAYEASVACTVTPHPLCPLYVVNDTRVAECNRGTHQCEMVAIDAIQCGGFVVDPHKCPDAYECHVSFPDAPGTCVATPTCVQNEACVMGSTWDATQCKCVPTTPPTDECGGCAAGQWCSFCFGHFACIPEHAVC
jgi:hypothetical protein